jgi:hypothetical protein
MGVIKLKGKLIIKAKIHVPTQKRINTSKILKESVSFANTLGLDYPIDHAEFHPKQTRMGIKGMLTLDGKRAILNEQALINSAKGRQIEHKLEYEQALKETYIETVVHELTHLKQRAENRHQRGGVYSPASDQEQEAKKAGLAAVELYRKQLNEPKGITIYHGSGNPSLIKDDITIFNEGRKQNKGSSKYGGLYGHTESDVHLAQNYANMKGGTPTVYAINLKPNVSILDKDGDITRLSEDFISSAKNDGHSVVRGKSLTGKIEYAVIDEKAIESLVPVTNEQIAEIKSIAKVVEPKNTNLENTPISEIQDILIAVRYNLEAGMPLSQDTMLKLKQFYTQDRYIIERKVSMALNNIPDIATRINVSRRLDEIVATNFNK